MLSDHGRITLSRRAGILPKQHRRAAARHPPFPDVIIYTAAATGTVIAESIAIPLSDFLLSPKIAFRGWIRATDDWAALFSETSSIYGLELTALVLTAADPRAPIDNFCITFYVGNNCTLSAILKAGCFRAAISGMARLFWAVCAVRGIASWVERVDSNVDISDIPTLVAGGWGGVALFNGHYRGLIIWGAISDSSEGGN